MIRRVSASRFVAFGFLVLTSSGCAGGESGAEGFPDIEAGTTADTTAAPEDTGSDFEIGGDDTTPASDDTGSTPPDSGEPEAAVEASTEAAAEASTDGAGDASGDGSGGDAADTAVADSASSDTGMPADTAGDPCLAALSCTDDADGDKIPDIVEGRCAAGGPTDTDGDGTPDYLDLDSDGDGIHDRAEWFAGGCEPTGGNDADGDGIPNFRDLDSDNNGLPDTTEKCPPTAVLTKLGMPACVVGTPYDFDGDGVPDFIDPENDHDSSSASKVVGLDDRYELTNKAGVYVGLVDSDGDGIPDLYDVDSDNDGILDADDGINDVDGDGLQNFRDTDSDGDGVPDSCEKRVDTDGDGKADYVDLDSDGDLLLDRDEDKDGNCAIGATETDRLKKDTDGDGVDDLIEVTLLGASGAKDPATTPAKAGKFYFVVPYSTDGSAAPTPASSLLALSTKLNKGDVGFVVDTTGSMGGEIAALKSSLSSTIIPALKTRIPDLGIGVAGEDDFPYSSYGYAPAGDTPFYLSGGANGYVTTVTATAQAAANALRLADGYDWPESQIPAMYKAITGAALSWPGGSLAADSPPAGTFGALRFRSDALPIVIPITDASMHNGKRALDKTATSYDGSLVYAYSFSTFNVDNLVTKLNELGAKFIGVGSDNGGRAMGVDDPYGYLSYIADKTSSHAPPSAFPGGTCKTGVGGAAVAADGPVVDGVRQCRLVFSINVDGSGLSTSIVDGVSALLNSIKFDVYVEAYNGAGEPIDVVTTFMEKVEPQPTGGTDPVTGNACVTFPATQLADVRKTPKAIAGAGDIKETILQVNPGAYYCFSVVPKPNTVVTAAASAKTYRAWLKVLAVRPPPVGGTFTLGADREVLFIVPPIAN
jgi:hypothetical protein